ncbi:hypothetical protein [Pseudobacteriovorax antillogorgiicola]|uniref:Uncharacterized protein n=1 Tax=Pseudobacteriovorax antillogorgiicola TaxID=1513793 RepID=A0A1Y6BDP8_9BACT|nr:hypothetical protein [Pseudobacteriovorax antillogorgiicola]TCS58499.1 hypothetical protein EDD56_10212 [Pseudobacteriovorax antillogorgiicola]SME98221.1 hypothetical protein SAMN06296036_102431 [Pseudobacteriovorax antillogorgiicola]
MHFKSLPLILASIIFTGCVTTQIPLDSSFTKVKSSTVGVGSKKHPEATFYQKGAQGILDMAISQGLNSSLIATLNAMRLDDEYTDGYEGKFSKALSGQERNVVTIESKTIMSLPEFKSQDRRTKGEDEIHYADLDYRQLKKDGIDFILVIEPIRYGLERAYYGFIPLGAPQGHAQVQFDLVDTGTNRIVWRDTAEVRSPITGEWDNPPAFAESKEAIRLSYQTALGNLLKTIEKNL